MDKIELTINYKLKETKIHIDSNQELWDHCRNLSINRVFDAIRDIKENCPLFLPGKFHEQRYLVGYSLF